MWSLIVGFFLPPVQAVIQQSHWPERIRALVNFASCAVAAFGVVYFTGSVNFRDWVQSALVVLVAAIATYKGTWKPTGIAPTIEAKTSTGPPPA